MKYLYAFVFLLFLCSPISISAQNAANVQVGLGILFKLDSSQGFSQPKITWCFPDAPALEAGICPGDYITSIGIVSTQNKTLDEIAQMLRGDESTSVMLTVNHNGSNTTYTLPYKKFIYTNCYYQTANPLDSFAAALCKLMNDAPYGFKHSVGAQTRVDSSKGHSNTITYYESNFEIPGTEKTEFAYFQSNLNAEITAASFAKKEDALKNQEQLLAKLKTDFPAYYQQAWSDKNDSAGYVLIGRQLDNGFEEAILTVKVAQVKKRFAVMMYIFNGERSLFYNIDSLVADSVFASTLLKMLNSVNDKFNAIKGTEHKPHAHSFRGAKWYETNTRPDGATMCTIGEEPLSDGCFCSFYEGLSMDSAQTVYDTLLYKVRAALGKTYSYNFQKPVVSLNIPSTAIQIANFARKTKREYEECPVLSLYIDKSDDGKYYVKMVFTNEGM